MRYLIAMLFIFGGTISLAQKDYGKEIIRKLTAPEFHGRGYVNGGDSLAAEYLQDEFEKIGAQTVDGKWFQSFEMDVNTFPDSVSVSINGQRLKTGVDFIVNPASGSAEGTYKTIKIDRNNFTDVKLYEGVFSGVYKKTNQLIVLDKLGVKNKDTLMEMKGIEFSLADHIPVLVLTDQKLTWSVSKKAYKFPIIEVDAELVADPIKEVTLNIRNKLKRGHKARNVVGVIPGKKKRKDILMVSAHYDHLGRMGSTAYIPGANDNASGVSMMLNLMKYYAENQPERTMVFVAFAAEEAGLIGSKYFVDNPLVDLDDIEFLLNLDLLGTGSEGITVVNATLHKKAFRRLLELNQEKEFVAKVKKRGEAANSDHYWFSKAGVPAFFIYTLGGVTYYHDVHDKADTLPLTKYNELHDYFIHFLDGF